MTTSPTTDRGATDATPDPRRWVSLAVVLAGAFMVLLDATIVNVAIPAMQVDLGASYGAIEWVVSGYALTFGLTLIPGGRLGDRFGYRRLFVLGMLGFVTTSALCGIAPTPETLVVARVAQGALAGLLTPQILAVIQVVFPPRERGRAFALYGIVAGVSVAAGPLLGGVLVHADIAGLLWRPIFLINVPIGVVAMIVAARLLPATRGRGGGLDPVGIALIGAALVLVTVPLIQGRDAGWPAWTWLSLAAALPVGAMFVWWERRRLRQGRDVLFDLRLFRDRSLAVGTAIGLTYFAGFIGLMFVVSLHLQLGLGRSALVAGLILMAFAVGSMIGGGVSDKVHARLGRGVLLLGSLLVAAGTVGVIITVDLAEPVALLPALFVVGLGNGLTIAPNVDIALESVPPKESGSAAGMVNTAQRIGNALGVAVVGVALFGVLGSHATTASQTVTAELRRDLLAAGESQPAADAGVERFVRCYVTRSNATDPTEAPPGCPTGGPGNPVADAYAHAAARAQAANFTHATQRAAGWALGAVGLTFLLSLLLPRRRTPGQSQGFTWSRRRARRRSLDDVDILPANPVDTAKRQVNRILPPNTKQAAIVVAGFTALLYLIELIDTVLPANLDQFGILPRSLGGLDGIAWAPLLHSGWGHLLANTLPVLIFGFLAMAGGLGQWIAVSLTIWLVSGVGVWLTGDGAVTVGASGLAFGWLAFLLVRGIFTRSALQLGVALVLFLYWGTMLLGVLPGSPGISWQGHLFGAGAGVLAAWLVAVAGRRAASKAKAPEAQTQAAGDFTA